MPRPPIRIACVGAGYFSRFHYESWARMPEVALVGACDHDLAKAHATGLPGFVELAEMLEQTVPDVLDIILPPAGHSEAIRMAISAGVGTIICQKPFCSSLDEAEAMVALAQHAGVTLIVHENFRFQPWYRAIKSAIRDGLIGQVQQATFRLRPGDGQGPEAYLDRQPYFQKMERFLVHETAVHLIDTFRFLLGDPVSVYADLRRLNPAIAGEDAGLIILEHPGNTRAVIDGNRHLDHDARNLRCTMGEGLFEGTEGTLSLRGDGSVWHRAFATRDQIQRLAPTDDDSFGGGCVHAFQRHVVNGLGGTGQIETLAEEYLEVLRIEAAVYASAQSGARHVLQARGA